MKYTEKHLAGQGWCGKRGVTRLKGTETHSLLNLNYVHYVGLPRQKGSRRPNGVVMASKNKGWNRKRPPAGGKKGGKSPLLPPHLNGFQFKFSIGYVIAMLVALAVFNILVSQNDDKVVPFSTFK